MQIWSREFNWYIYDIWELCLIHDYEKPYLQIKVNDVTLIQWVSSVLVHMIV